MNIRYTGSIYQAANERNENEEGGQVFEAIMTEVFQVTRGVSHTR